MFEKLKEKQEQRRLEEQRKQEEAMKRKQEELKILSDLAAAQAELNELKKEYGIQDEEKGLKKAISTFFDRREAREKVAVSKKKYMLLAVFLGLFGAHRFYSRQYPTAILYLLTCWTGFPVSMTVIDLLIVLPMKADENGKIMI